MFLNSSSSHSFTQTETDKCIVRRDRKRFPIKLTENSDQTRKKGGSIVEISIINYIGGALNASKILFHRINFAPKNTTQTINYTATTTPIVLSALLFRLFYVAT